MISRQKLIRLIRERQPEIVAMDNVTSWLQTEVSSSPLASASSINKLVQVTGGERPEALVRVARWNGITFDRTKPLQEAEACARLAARGVGQSCLHLKRDMDKGESTALAGRGAGVRTATPVRFTEP